MTVTNDKEVEISNLSEMLEGQVAVLSSGYLSAKESVDVLDALKSSKLFRAAQYSYILYPNKELPGFLDRNNIPKQEIEKSKLLQQLLSDGNTQIVEKDCLGNHHFNGDFNNVNSLKTALSNLSNSKYKILIAQESALLFEIFERIFNHKAFTGRSGTFFGYEGLGSIYWHMVSKLQLAAQEVTLNALANAEDSELIGRLYDHYFEINEGVGVNKSPKLYGGFPTDPYSHTPNTKGVQQPGMTGQVKEDILSRFGELGVCVKEGILQFNPSILRKEEFLLKPTSFTYVNVLGAFSSINLEENKECIEVHYNNGQLKIFDSLKLDKETSKSIFERDNSINSITVSIVK
jgi:hypothetical protein